MAMESEAFIDIPYVNAFQVVMQVKDKCFGFNLFEGYKDAIKDFKVA